MRKEKKRTKGGVQATDVKGFIRGVNSTTTVCPNVFFR